MLSTMRSATETLAVSAPAAALVSSSATWRQFRLSRRSLRLNRRLLRLVHESLSSLDEFDQPLLNLILAFFLDQRELLPA